MEGEPEPSPTLPSTEASDRATCLNVDLSQRRSYRLQIGMLAVFGPLLSALVVGTTKSQDGVGHTTKRGPQPILHSSLSHLLFISFSIRHSSLSHLLFISFSIRTDHSVKAFPRRAEGVGRSDLYSLPSLASRRRKVANSSDKSQSPDYPWLLLSNQPTAAVAGPSDAHVRVDAARDGLRSARSRRSRGSAFCGLKVV